MYPENELLLFETLLWISGVDIVEGVSMTRISFCLKRISGLSLYAIDFITFSFNF